PQPDGGRGKQEDEREGIRRGDEKADDAEGQERRRMACHLLLDADPAARDQPVSADEPPDAREPCEYEEPAGGPVDARERRRTGCAARPRADQRQEAEEHAAPQPEAEAAAVAAQPRRGRDAA